MKRDAYDWLFHASDAARQVLDELDPLYCESCGEAKPDVKERVLYHATCDSCQARMDEERREPEDRGESFGEMYAKRVRGDM